MEHFYWLDQIQLEHRGGVGDKALYLALLKQRGYPVMPGGVVAAPMLRAFLETMQWSEPLFADLPNSSLHLDVDNFRQLQAIAQQLCQQIVATPIPEDWLARLELLLQPWQASTVILQPSVAIAGDFNVDLSHPLSGLLQSQACQTESGAIALGLQRVWSELFRAKSLLYWQRLGVPLQRVRLAVLIQPMELAIASGTVQITPTTLEVRSVWGLGQALTDGIVRADVYRANPETGLVQSQEVNPKRYAYGVGAGTPEWAVQQQALSRLSRDSLTIYPVAPQHQHQPSLGDRPLQQLIQMARQLLQEWNQPLWLEWTLAQPLSCESLQSDFMQSGPALSEPIPSAEPLLYLTAMLPYSMPVSSISTPVNAAIATANAIPAATVAPNPAHGELSSSKPNALVELNPVALSGLVAMSGQVLAQAWVVEDGQPLEDIPLNAVLIASRIQPHWAAALRQVAAVVTEQGGLTSHGAILAREVGIPAVVGVAGARQHIRSGDIVFVDGDRGQVYRLTAPDQLDALIDKPTSTPVFASLPPIEPAPAIATQLMVNLSQTHRLSDIATLPVDGVGLLRSELLMREVLQTHPHDWLRYNSNIELIESFGRPIYQVAQAFAPRPIFYRSLDLRSHELAMEGAVLEANPTLGVHGTLSYQIDPRLFEIELAALRRVQHLGCDNVRLLLPFVRTVEEFEFCRDRVVQAGLTQNPHFQLWIMAEVPSVLFLLPEYVKAGVQGVSIGSNDLTQLMLAIDRDHPQMTATFNQHHPAVLRAMEHLIRAAQQAGIPCSICGEAPIHNPELIERLVEWGITAISVSPNAVESTYQAIAQAERQLRG